MQDIIVAKPYQFVPPIVSRVWIPLVRMYVPWKVRRSWGVSWPTFRHMEKLKESFDKGHGIILAPKTDAARRWCVRGPGGQYGQ